MTVSLKWIKKYALTNAIALVMYLISPIRWSSPFGTAFLAAAGMCGLGLKALLPGALAGAFIGEGGIGAVIGGVAAHVIAQALCAKNGKHSLALLSAVSLTCCFVPAVVYHWPYGAYDVLTGICASLIAMAACPVMVPALTQNAFRATPLEKEVRVAALFLCALMVSGIARCLPLAASFLAGLFVLVMSFGGFTASLIGSLCMSVGLLLGNGAPSQLMLLVLSASACGWAAKFGMWAQSALFLVGIPLSAYFGFEPANACMLSAAAVYPWIPKAFCLSFLRKMGFMEREAFLTAATARRHLAPPGNRICGDAGAVTRLPGERMLFMLADGMGTGEKARKISNTALESAKNIFLSPISDMDKLKCINALCMQDGHTHTTLDICQVDLLTGRAKFIKSGAEPGWIITNKRVQRLTGESLPLGVLEKAPAAEREALLSPGDMVFMATDGLINALGGTDSAECLLIRLKDLSPGRICEEVMNQAKSMSPARRKDDMSILCARIGGKAVVPRALLPLYAPSANEKKQAEKQPAA